MNKSDVVYTIMVVDDTPENIAILDGLLSDQYNIIVAKNGVDAIRLLETTNPKPDLILLDIMMPVMDGYQVCELIKKDVNYRDIPIIFITALTSETSQEKGFRYGAVDYITKPFSPTIVSARIRTHLMLYDQKRSLEVQVSERTASLKELSVDIIHRLGRAAEFKDNETGLHVIRMSFYCKLLAEAIGMSDKDVDILYEAAPMHDIGKIGIPDNVLLKKGTLNEEEWVVMKKHSEYGAQIIGEHDSDLLRMAYLVAMNHHEKWDGTGYPQGLKGEEIPIQARIVTVCDVFDALTSERVYKKAWPVEEAFQYLQDHAGTYYDPKLVNAFIQIKDKVLSYRKSHLDKERSKE